MGWAPAGRVQCGATRLVRLLLGPTSVSPHKLECGNPLVILGVRITLSKNGMQFTPDPQKVARWTQQIDAALAAGRLCAGESSKLAGASRGGAKCCGFVHAGMGRSSHVGVDVCLQESGAQPSVSTLQAATGTVQPPVLGPPACTRVVADGLGRREV